MLSASPAAGPGTNRAGGMIAGAGVARSAAAAADLAAGAVLLEVAAHPAAGNSTIKNASPEAGIFKSDKVSLMPGL